MLLFHASPITNRASIERHGLLTMFARGRLKRIWACRKSRIPWAIRHVMGRHPDAAHGVDVWCVSVPDAQTTKTHMADIRTTAQDVPPECVTLFSTFAEMPVNDSHPKE